MLINTKKIRLKNPNKEGTELNREFLVVDHPNPISRKEYEEMKELFYDVSEDEVSYKGVF